MFRQVGKVVDTILGALPTAERSHYVSKARIVLHPTAERSHLLRLRSAQVFRLRSTQVGKWLIKKWPLNFNSNKGYKKSPLPELLK